MISCMICYKSELCYNERVDVDCVCSSCVQRLLKFSQNELSLYRVL